MTSREKILDDFRDKFIATIGTAGSKDGMALSEAAMNFSKDWSISLDVFKRDLGHKTLQGLLYELRDVVEIRNDRVYAIVNDSNTHVFGLIDRTKKKKKRNKSQSPFAFFSLSSKREIHFSKKTSWEQNYFGSRTPRFLSSGGRSNLSMSATPLHLIGTFPSAFCHWQPLTAPKPPTSSTAAVPNHAFLAMGDQKPNTPFQFPRPWYVPPPPILNGIEGKATPPTQLLRQPPLSTRSCPSKASTETSSTADGRIPRTSTIPLLLAKLPASKSAKATTAKTGTLTKSADAMETKKRVLDADIKLSSSADCWTPTKSPPCKTANVIDRNFQCSGLFRSQILQIQRVTASSPQSKDSRTLDSIKKPVREIVAIIYTAGRSIKLEELKKRYYDIYQSDLTGVKLAEVLELEPTKKNHFIAFQSFRPPIFSCVLHNADVLVSLSKECNPLLDKMRSIGELTSANVPLTPALSAPSDVSTTTTSMSIRNVEKKSSVTLPTIVRKEPVLVANVLPTLKTSVIVKKFSQTLSTPTYVSKSHSVEPVKKQKSGGVPAGVRLSLSPPQQPKASAPASSASAVTSGTDVDNDLDRRLSADFSRLTIKDESTDEHTAGSRRSDISLTKKRDGDTHFHSAHMKSLLNERFVSRIANKFQLSGSKWKEMKQQFAAINNFD